MSRRPALGESAGPEGTPRVHAAPPVDIDDPDEFVGDIATAEPGAHLAFAPSEPADSARTLIPGRIPGPAPEVPPLPAPSADLAELSAQTPPAAISPEPPTPELPPKEAPWEDSPRSRGLLALVGVALVVTVVWKLTESEAVGRPDAAEISAADGPLLVPTPDQAFPGNSMMLGVAELSASDQYIGPFAGAQDYAWALKVDGSHVLAYVTHDTHGAQALEERLRAGERVTVRGTFTFPSSATAGRRPDILRLEQFELLD